MAVSTAKQRADEMSKEVKEHVQQMAGPVQEGVGAAGEKLYPWYFGLTAASLVFSVILFFRQKKQSAIFVGLWPPTFLALGIFHKLMSNQQEK